MSLSLCLLCLFLCVRYKQLLQRKGELEELEKNLKEQQNKMALENQAHQATADQCKLLKEENDRSDQQLSLLTLSLSTSVFSMRVSIC